MAWLSDKTIDHLREITELPDLGGTKYTCIGKIASGGMGSVYLAEDKHLQRQIALKILDIPDPEGSLAARMLQEAHVIAALEHPSIVPIHDVGTLPDGRVYYTMKLVKGWRLDDQIETTPTIPEFLRTLQKVCEGVAFAHAHGVIHRDLKPENIMVGDFGEVLVMDWGIAKLFSPDKSGAAEEPPSFAPDVVEPRQPPALTKSSNLTEHGTVMGTPAYMAPEQQRGEIDRIDERTDIYALGAILETILRTIYQKQSQTKNLTYSLRNPFQKGSVYTIPKQLQAIADKALADDKKDRYSNALALKDDIENYLNGHQVAAYKENLLETLWRKVKQNRFLIFLIITYIVAQLTIRLLTRL